MPNFFTLPDKKIDSQKYMVHILAIIWCTVISIVVCIGYINYPEAWQRWASILVASLFIGIFNITINRAGYTRISCWSLTIMIWLLITLPCLTGGGISSSGIMSQMSVILTAVFLIGWRGGVAIGLVTIAFDFWMAYIETIGILPTPTVIHSPISKWIGTLIPFSTFLALQYYATNHMRTGLIALEHEIIKREEAEKIKEKTVHNLEKRINELKTLYTVSRILQNKEVSTEKLYSEIVEVIPMGWNFPNITSARLSVADKDYTTINFKKSKYSLLAEMKTLKGTKIDIEIAYSMEMQQFEEDPFLKEEYSLIKMLIELLTIDLEQRERKAELKDYKYALDISSIVCISDGEGIISFVNENFCNASRYSASELIGKHQSITLSPLHTPDYITELRSIMEKGQTYRGELCNLTKDGTLFWIDIAIVPFLDENGKIYQYLSISHDITKRKEGEEIIKDSEKLLRKITNQIPGNTYMFETEKTGQYTMLFMNRGTDAYNYEYDLAQLNEHPEKLIENIHTEDLTKLNDAITEAIRTESMISVQYRIVVDNHIRWRWLQATPEKSNTEKTIWYGASSDINPLVDYLASIEQIVFDISHVIRRPVSSMLGLTQVLIDEKLTYEEIKELSIKLHTISEEMDKFITELGVAYNLKRQNTKFNIDIISSLDKRNDLFS
jgi:PAS domain S-box-containing protein